MIPSRCCGRVGCHNEADVVVDHPEFGERTVCSQHAKAYEVIRDV